MEFSEKLQTLRKSKGLTQEELAQRLYVSRAAVSKWESGREYPSIDSLKAIAGLFCVTIDELLSSGEALTIAEKDACQKRAHLCDLVLGCLDCSFAMFFILPIFGQTTGGSVRDVSLTALSGIQPWLKTAYLAVISLSVIFGILTLALQNSEFVFWVKQKYRLSLLINLLLTFLFILSRQPYAAAFALIYLIIKVLILTKKQ